MGHGEGGGGGTSTYTYGMEHRGLGGGGDTSTSKLSFCLTKFWSMGLIHSDIFYTMIEPAFILDAW